MKYLKKFDTSAEFEAAYDGTGYTEPWTSLSPVTVMTIDAGDGDTFPATYIGVFYFAGEPSKSYENQGYWKVWQSVEDGFMNFFPLDEHGSMPDVGEYLPYECLVENGMITDLHDVGATDYQVVAINEIPGMVTYNKKGVHHKIYIRGYYSVYCNCLVRYSIDTDETTLSAEDLEDITMAYECYYNGGPGGDSEQIYGYLRYSGMSPERGKEWKIYSLSDGFYNCFTIYNNDGELAVWQDCTEEE